MNLENKVVVLNVKAKGLINILTTFFDFYLLD